MTAAAGATLPLSPVTLNVFPGGFNWPSFAALDKGLFAANGLEVTLQATLNSVAQMTGLANGAFDIAMTAVDNIVAYVEGHGEAPIGPQPDFFAFMGSDNGFLSLVARPGIKRIEDLKGKTLSVDARTTGYAFVLLDMLRRGGLTESDYEIVKVGGMVQRWEALYDGKQDATLLSAPYDILAVAKGLNRLARATSMIGRYQGNVAAAKRSWAVAHEKEVVGFIRAYVAAIDWLYEAGNRDEAVHILTKHLRQMPHALARQSYDLMLDREEGFLRHGKIDLDGLTTVVELRSRYGEAKSALTDAAKYYDPAYNDLAVRG